MPSQQDLIPQYLAQLLASNTEGQQSANTPFQTVAAPADEVTVTDTVTATAVSGPFRYGHCYYGSALYGN